MTREQADALMTLRDEGHAVAVFTPDELNGADPDVVEDLMVERGWMAVDSLGGKS
jgi:hypothetical protein